MKLNAINVALWHSGNCLLSNHAINGRSDFFQRAGRRMVFLDKGCLFRGVELIFEA